MKSKKQSRTLWINGIATVLLTAFGSIQIITPLLSATTASVLLFIAGIGVSAINYYLKNQDFDKINESKQSSD